LKRYGSLASLSFKENFMSRSLLRPVVAAAAAAFFVKATGATESYTTRIEPRNVYGATVTIEEGVRVFRPLPTERRVFVNPGGMTPLYLEFDETRVREESSSTNNFYGNGDSSSVGGGWGGPSVGGRPFMGHSPGFGHSGGFKQRGPRTPGHRVGP
jgi:hypothetical protein